MVGSIVGGLIALVIIGGVFLILERRMDREHQEWLKKHNQEIIDSLKREIESLKNDRDYWKNREIERDYKEIERMNREFAEIKFEDEFSEIEFPEEIEN